MKRMQKAFLMVALVVMLAVPFIGAHAITSNDLGIGNAQDQFGGTTLLGKKPLAATVAAIINTALSILGVVAVVIIIAGGFMWMTAAGDNEKVKKAQGLIKNGIIGLAIILSAYAIATFVIDKLVAAVN